MYHRLWSGPRQLALILALVVSGLESPHPVSGADECSLCSRLLANRSCTDTSEYDPQGSLVELWIRELHRDRDRDGAPNPGTGSLRDPGPQPQVHATAAERRKQREECACQPCPSSGAGTNAYQWWMANPEDFCDPHFPDQGGPDFLGFLDVARKHLRGKRVVLYGDSVFAQLHFAMLCEARRHRLLEVPFWPDIINGKDNYHVLSFENLAWWQGVYIPELDVNLTYYTLEAASDQFCPGRDGAPKYHVCFPFVEHAVAHFDVVMTNHGHHYSKMDQYVPEMEQLFALLDQSARSKGILPVWFDTTAEHFTGTRGGTGQYMDREHPGAQEGIAADECACGPLGHCGFDPKNFFADSIGRHFPHVRRMPMFELTKRKFAMHMAYSESKRQKLVCDCLHFCFNEAWYKGEVFPILDMTLGGSCSACFAEAANVTRSMAVEDTFKKNYYFLQQKYPLDAPHP